MLMTLKKGPEFTTLVYAQGGKHRALAAGNIGIYEYENTANCISLPCVEDGCFCHDKQRT